MHFTRVEHLRQVANHGLVADRVATERGLLEIEVGNPGIKALRRAVTVKVPPGGYVGDYAPFYFAPRSPMLYSIYRGNVPTYTGGCADLVYLITTVETLLEAARPLVFTDRNAALSYAKHSRDVADLESMIDWQLMEQRIWRNTPDEPDRMERRMAECLVHEVVPWKCFLEIAVANGACASQAEAVLTRLSLKPTISVRPEWYF